MACSHDGSAGTNRDGGFAGGGEAAASDTAEGPWAPWVQVESLRAGSHDVGGAGKVWSCGLGRRSFCWWAGLMEPLCVGAAACSAVEAAAAGAAAAASGEAVAPAGTGTAWLT
jgi:hypothetical protein